MTIEEKKEKRKAYDKARYKVRYKAHPIKVMTPEERLKRKRASCKRWAAANYEKRLAYAMQWRKNNKDKTRAYDKNKNIKDPKRSQRWRKNNINKARAKDKANYIKHRAKKLARMKQWRQTHRESDKERKKKYQASHRKEINAYIKKLKQNNLSFKISCVLRNRITTAIKEQVKREGNISIHKCDKTFALIGCTIQAVIKHLESLWKPGMNWKNHSLYGWHIDHIRPCSSFDLTDPAQQRLCFHWTNLQPLWACENLEKSNKIK